MPGGPNLYIYFFKTTFSLFKHVSLAEIVLVVVAIVLFQALQALNDVMVNMTGCHQHAHKNSS